MILRTIRQRLAVWQWIAAACLLAAAPAHASVQELRVVGVGISNSSLQAEEYALDYARKRAVFLAARKLGIKDASKQLAKFTSDEWKKIIRGATITQTRRDGYTTYIEANVTLVDEALRRALKIPERDLKSEPPVYDSRGVLLLAAFVGKDRAYLWEKENILREPLADEIRRQSHGAVLLPGGDINDLRLVDYQNALTVKPEELKPMYDRYGAEEIIIAALSIGQPGTTDNSHVLLRRLKEDNVRIEVMDIPVEGAEETMEARLNKAASSIAGAVTKIATSTAEREQALRQQAKKLTVRFSYSTPRDLARMQQTVVDSPEVLYLDMPSIALARVAGTIYLKGDDEALREGLTKQGLIVTTISDGWRLSVR